MLPFLGLVILIGSLIDYLIEGFNPLQIMVSLLGVCLALWGLFIPFLKSKIANSKLSFASGFFSRAMLIIVIAGLCFSATTLFASPEIYAAEQIKEAQTLAAQKNFSKAYDLLKALSEKYPETSFDAKREMAFQDMAQKRNEEAARLLDEILTAKPYDLEARYGKVLLYTQNKDWKNAQIEARKILLYNPHYPEAYVALGDSYSEAGDLIRTIHYYNLAIRENPDLTDAHFKLGTAYRKSHSNREALDEYQKALSLASTDDEKSRISQGLRDLTKEIDQS
ncbi:MAG: tetratricopeptide repeat protein [Desulfitobacteriaceae bacterium]